MKSEPQPTIDEKKFRAFFPIGEGLSILLYPYAEVVLHDIASGRIVRIWNAFSARKAGDPSHLEGAPDLFTEQLVLGPYEKALPTRGRTKSMTSALLDANGQTMGFFCINLDVTHFDTVIGQLSAFIQPEIRRPEPIYRNDLQEHINYTVRDYLISINKTIETLNRAERVGLISEINRSGLFQARNAVQMVAKVMRVSRAGVYNMLADARVNGAQNDDAAKRASSYPRTPSS